MINMMLLATRLAVSAMNGSYVEFQDSESLEQSLDRHAVARARLSAGLVESGELTVASPDWALADMPWVVADYDGSFASSDDAKVNPFVGE